MACMNLHAECGTSDTPSAHARLGFARYMQLHKKRCTKRAGEAGVALRAGAFSVLRIRIQPNNKYFYSIAFFPKKVTL